MSRCPSRPLGLYAGHASFELAADAAFFDALPLECDGLVSVVSAVLARDGIPHRTMCGPLTVEDVGTIAVHCWIAFASGQILDMRARMWLGADPRVPHGIFHPAGAVRYGSGREFHPDLSAGVFMVLTGRSVASVPALLVPSSRRSMLSSPTSIE